MKSSRFTETQRRAIVDSQKSKTVKLICREDQISPGTFYKWKESFSIRNNEDKKRLKKLEKENEQLKNGAAFADLQHVFVDLFSTFEAEWFERVNDHKIGWQ